MLQPKSKYIFQLSHPNPTLYNLEHIYLSSEVLIMGDLIWSVESKVSITLH